MLRPEYHCIIYSALPSLTVPSLTVFPVAAGARVVELQLPILRGCGKDSIIVRRHCDAVHRSLVHVGIKGATSEETRRKKLCVGHCS